MPTDQPANWDATRPWGIPDAAAVPRPDAGDDTLREQVVETLRKYSDRTDGYQLGADKVMELFAAAVQAEREQVRDEGMEQACDSCQDEREKSEAAVKRVHALLDRSDNRNGSPRPRQDCIPATEILDALDGINLLRVEPINDR